MMEQVLVVGPGRVGKCLALIHQRAGANVLLLGRQQGLWMEWSRAHEMEPILDLCSVSRDNTLVLLTVPDRELESVLAQCQEHFTGTHNTVVHTSGAVGSELFQHFGNQLPQCAAIHPLMAFSGDPELDAATLATSMASVATDFPQREVFDAILTCWGARGLSLAANVDRASYHLGLSLLSNHVTALCGWAQDLLHPALGEQAGDVVAEMAARAVSASVEHGAAAALTGPVVRGDVETVKAHLAALPEEQAARYCGALLAVIDLACASGRLSDAAALQLRALAAGHLQP